MTEIIDFKNARYQGSTKNHQPHGLGIIVDYKNLFCLAEWEQGLIHGKCVIIFGDSKIFYGQVYNGKAQGICTYHLKDKCQIFCNFQPASSTSSQSNKLVALLPTFNMIIKVQGDSEQQLQIKNQQNYKQGDLQSLNRILQTMLDYRFKKQQLQQYLSLQSFLDYNFFQDYQYKHLLDYILMNSDQGKQMFLSLKTNNNQPSLGIKILNCMENLTNKHNDGNSYIVRAMGYFSRDAILKFGVKTIKTMIKGSIKEQAIYKNDKTILRYEQNQRPKQCSINRMNYLKQSVNFNNQFLSTGYLYMLHAECLNINFNIKQNQTKRVAQLVLQNPKQLSMQEKDKIERNRTNKLSTANHTQKGGDSQTISPNPYKTRIDKYVKKNDQLQKTKQQIYKSVSKKKLNSTSSNINGFLNTSNTNLSPQKQLKPSQLTNVKPMKDLYNKMTEQSFYNSIVDGNSIQHDKINNNGYKYSIGKVPSDDIKKVQNVPITYNPYTKNATKNEPQESQNLTKRKFHYLPDETQLLSNSRRSNQYNMITQPKISNFQYSNYKNRSIHQYDSKNYQNRIQDTVPQSVYNPHAHYHQHLEIKRPQQKYFPSSNKTRNDYRHSSTYGDDNMVGKIGKRVSKRPNQNQLTYVSPQKFTQILKNPIIVPQFNLKPQPNTKQYKQSNTKSYKQWKQQQLKQSPNKYDNTINPNINYAKETTQNKSPYKRNNYLRDQKVQERGRSPGIKRKRILNQNPFQK